MGPGTRIGGGPALAAIATLAALLISCMAAPASAQETAETLWVCNPALADDVCRGSLETTAQSADEPDQVRKPRQSKNARTDCFYVYPTISDQPTLNADRSIDEQIEGITALQANYFSRHCAIYAPVYRQVTVPALLSRSGDDLARGLRMAYPDVEAAWLDYWRNVNRGKRRFVLIGHSQGSGMLIELIRRLIDDRPRMRKRMLSAIVPGVVPSVPVGERVGGDFDNVPTCGKRRQTGCVMAWATYDETPPDDARYGIPSARFSQAFGWEFGPQVEAVCTNPARLRGGSGELRTLVRSEGFPGLVGLAFEGLYEFDRPSAETPWVRPADRFSGECVHDNGTHILKTSPIGAARDYRASPDDTWGLHLLDINIGLGNLIKVVRAEKRSSRKR